MSQKRDNEIGEILYKTIQAKSAVSWKVIVGAVKAKMEIKNWYEVRDVLQAFLDSNIIKRVPNYNVEEYLRIGVWS